MTNPAPALASLLPSVGAAVAHVVDRALAFEKAKRWPDATRMQEGVRHAYHDRNGAPITTAPRLTVPESVPDRAPPVPTSLPTTGQPFARTRSLPVHLSRNSVLVISIGGGIAVLGVAIGVAGRKPVAARALDPAPVMAVNVSPVALPAVPTASATPEVAATDLPAEPIPAVPKPSPTAKPPPIAPPAAVTAHPIPTTPAPVATCNPPFVLDSTGKKHWKAQCL
jgi:serine/threonine-protein kinase